VVGSDGGQERSPSLLSNDNGQSLGRKLKRALGELCNTETRKESWANCVIRKLLKREALGELCNTETTKRRESLGRIV